MLLLLLLVYHYIVIIILIIRIIILFYENNNYYNNYYSFPVFPRSPSQRRRNFHQATPFSTGCKVSCMFCNSSTRFVVFRLSFPFLQHPARPPLYPKSQPVPRSSSSVLPRGLFGYNVLPKLLIVKLKFSKFLAKTLLPGRRTIDNPTTV